MCNSGCIPPEPGFLGGLRKLCDQYGIVLIFDEVITGFRVGLGGAQERFGVVPDVAVFGKAMASGYPISVIAGKRKFMQPIADGVVIHAGTMNTGNPSVAAALATLHVLETDQVHERLYRHGLRLMEGLREAGQRAGQPILVQGLGPMFHVGFTPLPKVRDLRDSLSYDKAKGAKFVAGMHDRGIRLIGRGLWYISAAHTGADIDRALATATEVLQRL
jgi:glutamate-1-semialdehyde 2,1-aminomutase